MNTKFLSTALTALTLAMSLSSCQVFQGRETTGEYIDDSSTTTAVKAAIFNEPDLKSLDIGVETLKGVVQLSGFVETVHQFNKAREVARHVHGVYEVRNNLIVKH